MIWDDLRYLEVLARSGSVAAAARELNCSVSTVYRRIAVLEKGLGASCLIKGADGELTEIGRMVLSVARKTKEGLGHVATTVARRSQADVSGTVGLTTVDAMVPVLGRALFELSQAYPRLTVDLRLGESGPSLRRHEIDVALGVMRRPSSTLIGTPLFRIDYGVYGTAAACARSPRTWIVAGAPIQSAPESEWERRRADAIVVTTASRLASLEFARLGIGVALLPTSLARLHPDLIEVEEYRNSLREIPERHAWLLVHPERRMLPNVQVLTAVLLESLGEPSA